MLSAVIYEETYVLYDQRHERSIWDVVLQHDGETEEDFYARVEREVGSLKSLHSYYESETFEYTFPE